MTCHCRDSDTVCLTLNTQTIIKCISDYQRNHLKFAIYTFFQIHVELFITNTRLKALTPLLYASVTSHLLTSSSLLRIHVQCASSLLMVFPLLRKSICPLIQINVSAISCTLLLLRSYSQIKVSIRLGTSKASMHFVTFRCNYHGMSF